jgi:hypothetical protein
MKFVSVCLIATLFATVYTMPAIEARSIGGIGGRLSRTITAGILDPDSDLEEKSDLGGALDSSS